MIIIIIIIIIIIMTKVNSYSYDITKWKEIIKLWQRHIF